ncbi:MAG: hypothetical protein JRE40_00125 [Deltaproteobacteria bacterium]|nr:hypothetical protein [Deltaproteobacteria bacterium]
MAILSMDIDDTDVPLIRDMVHARTGHPEWDDQQVVTWLKAELIQRIHLLVGEHQLNVVQQAHVPDMPIIT